MMGSLFLISGILDYLEGFSLENLHKVGCYPFFFTLKTKIHHFTDFTTMKVYEIFSHLALLARSSADSYVSSFANELFMIVRKQVQRMIKFPFICSTILKCSSCIYIVAFTVVIM